MREVTRWMVLERMRAGRVVALAIARDLGGEELRPEVLRVLRLLEAQGRVISKRCGGSDRHPLLSWRLLATGAAEAELSHRLHPVFARVAATLRPGELRILISKGAA